MKAGLQQSTQLKQELKINPRLYQAMDLLYMPLLDLQQHLKQELLNNPFLEMVEMEEEEDEEEESPETEAATEEDKGNDEIDWEEILLDGFDAGGRREEHEEREYYEPVTVDTRDLSDHLRDQIALQELSPLEVDDCPRWTLGKETYRITKAIRIPYRYKHPNTDEEVQASILIGFQGPGY